MNINKFVNKNTIINNTDIKETMTLILSIYYHLLHSSKHRGDYDSHLIYTIKLYLQVDKTVTHFQPVYSYLYLDFERKRLTVHGVVGKFVH